MKAAAQCRKQRRVSHLRRRPTLSAAARRVRLRGAEPSRVPENGLIPNEQIRAYCDAIVREFHPQKIVLFGSYAYGQPTPNSDVDLLVILPFRGSDVAKSIQIRSRFDTPFPMDLIVRRPEFIARRLGERDMFIELIMTQGRVMYESQHA